MAIARLIQPDELGVFSVAMALLMLAGSIRDMGAGQYVVQVKELTAARVRAAWTLQFGLGCALALLIAVLAYPAGLFYNESRITPILWLMAIAYVVNPMGSITYALLMREMQFGRVAIMRFAAAASTALVSVGLAAQDFGPISLAWGSLTGTCVNALVSQFFRPANLPWGFNIKGVPEVLGFGGRIAGSGLIGTLSSSVPDFVLGKLQGMHAAGLYSRCNGLVAMFSRLITDAVFNVAMALFAQQHRQDQDVAASFLRAFSYISMLSSSFALGLILLAHPVVRALYGNQWDETISLTRWLALGIAFGAPSAICSAACTGLGRADIVLRATSITAAVWAAATLVGASISLKAMVMLVPFEALFSAFIWLSSVKALVGFSWSTLFKTAMHSYLVALGAASSAVAVVAFAGLEPSHPWFAILACLALSALTVPAAIVLGRHPLRDEINRVPLLKRLTS